MLRSLLTDFRVSDFAKLAWKDITDEIIRVGTLTIVFGRDIARTPLDHLSMGAVTTFYLLFDDLIKVEERFDEIARSILDPPSEEITIGELKRFDIARHHLDVVIDELKDIISSTRKLQLRIQ